MKIRLTQFIVRIACASALVWAVKGQVTTSVTTNSAALLPKRDISKWDLNNNGKLEPKEMEAFRRDQAHEQEDQFRLRAKAAAEARRIELAARTNRMVPPALLLKYDANTNGMMDPEEWQKYREDADKRKAEWLRLHSPTTSPASASPASDKPPTQP